MGRPPKTGMERLLRLRDVQIATARTDAQTAEHARRTADAATHHAQHSVMSLAAARHASQRDARLDLARWSHLLDGEALAAERWIECAAESERRQQVAQTAAKELQDRLRQRKAAETRQQRLRAEIERARDARLDAQLADLWQIRRTRTP